MNGIEVFKVALQIGVLKIAAKLLFNPLFEASGNHFGYLSRERAIGKTVEQKGCRLPFVQPGVHIRKVERRGALAWHLLLSVRTQSGDGRKQKGNGNDSVHRSYRGMTVIALYVASAFSNTVNTCPRRSCWMITSACAWRGRSRPPTRT